MNTQQIYESLCDQIARGEYLRGSRLPTEADLVMRFGVGRGTVRKALNLLKEDGVITSRQGSGSYVVARPITSVDAPNLVSSLADVERLFEFRMLLECSAARLAAERRTEEDLARIDAQVVKLRAAIGAGHMGAEEDFDLHVQIARASGNKFLLTATLQLQTNVLFGMELGRKISVLPSPVRLKLVEAEHAAIIEPIRNGDQDSAETAMRDHIELSLRRIRDGEL